MTRAQKMKRMGMSAISREVREVRRGGMRSSIKYLDGGEFDREAGAVGRVGLDEDGSFVKADDALGERQSEAEAAGFAGAAPAVKGLEDLRQLIFGDDVAAVDDA